MGVFSWITSDTKVSVPNCMIGKPPTRPVKMIDDKGNEWPDEAYDGYGRFAGKGFYALLAEMNGIDGTDEEKFDKGINLAFSKSPHKAPKIVEADCTIPYDQLPDSESCPAQGHFYDDEEAEFITKFTEQREVTGGRPKDQIRPEETVR
jgi:hypothetical protein